MSVWVWCVLCELVHMCIYLCEHADYAGRYFCLQITVYLLVITLESMSFKSEYKSAFTRHVS